MRSMVRHRMAKIPNHGALHGESLKLGFDVAQLVVLRPARGAGLFVPPIGCSGRLYPGGGRPGAKHRKSFNPKPAAPQEISITWSLARRASRDRPSKWLARIFFGVRPIHFLLPYLVRVFDYQSYNSDYQIHGAGVSIPAGAPQRRSFDDTSYSRPTPHGSLNVTQTFPWKPSFGTRKALIYDRN
jgi:hypothetical protein